MKLNVKFHGTDPFKYLETYLRASSSWKI